MTPSLKDVASLPLKHLAQPNYVSGKGDDLAIMDSSNFLSKKSDLSINEFSSR